MRGTTLAAVLLTAAALSMGCSSNKLETGYKFQRLGSSTPVQRRAYYAGPFSPEARDAMMGGNGEHSGAPRRPRPGM